MDHVITVGDLAAGFGLAALAVVVFVIFAIAAVEFGWLDR